MLRWLGTLDANTVGWIIVGAMQLLTLSYQRKMEKNTNSKFDMLLRVRGDQQYAAGKEDQRVAGETIATAVARETALSREKP